MPTGIYSGGACTIDGSNINIDPLLVEIGDGTRQVRIETQAVVAVTPDSTNRRIVMRYTYQEQEDWYAEFVCVPIGGQTAYDLIIADVSFAAGVPVGISYRYTSIPNIGRVGITREEFIIAVENQTVLTLTGQGYFSGLNQLWVFVNGVKQRVDIDYAEDSVNGLTVIFSAGLTIGDVVECLIIR